MKKNYIYYAIVMIAMLFVASCNPEDLTDEDKQQIQQQADSNQYVLVVEIVADLDSMFYIPMIFDTLIDGTVEPRWRNPYLNGTALYGPGYPDNYKYARYTADYFSNYGLNIETENAECFEWILPGVDLIENFNTPLEWLTFPEYCNIVGINNPSLSASSRTNLIWRIKGNEIEHEMFSGHLQFEAHNSNYKLNVRIYDALTVGFDVGDRPSFLNYSHLQYSTKFGHIPATCDMTPYVGFSIPIKNSPGWYNNLEWTYNSISHEFTWKNTFDLTGEVVDSLSFSLSQYLN